jgi:hypothetical protein
VLATEHEEAECARCGSNLCYVVKEEETGWKVFYECRPSSGCGKEWFVGRISLSQVEKQSEVYELASEMWDEVI